MQRPGMVWEHTFHVYMAQSWKPRAGQVGSPGNYLVQVPQTSFCPLPIPYTQILIQLPDDSRP